MADRRVLTTLLTRILTAETPSWTMYDEARQAAGTRMSPDDWRRMTSMLDSSAWLSASQLVADRVRDELETWTVDGFSNALVGPVRVYSSSVRSERPDLGLLAAATGRLIMRYDSTAPLVVAWVDPRQGGKPGPARVGWIGATRISEARATAETRRAEGATYAVVEDRGPVTAPNSPRTIVAEWGTRPEVFGIVEAEPQIPPLMAGR